MIRPRNSTHNWLLRSVAISAPKTRNVTKHDDVVRAITESRGDESVVKMELLHEWASIAQPGFRATRLGLPQRRQFALDNRFHSKVQLSETQEKETMCNDP